MIETLNWRKDTPVTLGELQSALRLLPASLPVVMETVSSWRAGGGRKLTPTNIGSWRGVYAEPTLESDYCDVGGRLTTVGMILAWIAMALQGEPFVGYKGGEYHYHRDSPLHADNWGAYTEGSAVIGLTYFSEDEPAPSVVIWFR